MSFWSDVPGMNDRGSVGGDPDDGDRVLVLNPISGSGDHGPRIRELAAEYGFAVRETEEGGDAVEFAREAGESGAVMVAACGGDGTINEVLHGLDEADALEEVTFGVVPAGTGNNFADNIGIEGIEHAFEVLDSGETRRIDVGTAEERLFVNSCIGGLTADASAGTTSEMKNRFGVHAYVLSGLRTATEFDGIHLDVAGGPEHGGDVLWSGEALFVLVGNGRRYPAEGRTQANMEDGLLDVTIIEQMPAVDLLGKGAVSRLFGGESEHVTRLKSTELGITSRDGDPVSFSLDGEMVSREVLELGVRPRSLSLRVGEAYEPIPEA